MKWSKRDVGTQKFGPGSDTLDSEPKRASWFTDSGASATRTSAPTHDQQMRRRGLPSHACPRPGGPLSFQPVADDPMRGRHPCGTVFPAPQAGLLPPRG